MGSVIGRKYEIDSEELTDAGVSRDENGRVNDPKELLKHCLIKKWATTKEVYGKFNEA